MKTIITLLFFALTSTNLLSDTTSIKYFPLIVGNIYIYNVSESWTGPPGSYRDTVHKAIITRDTIALERRYYKLSGFPRFIETKWYRVDTLTSSIFQFNPSNTCPYYISESFFDSLAANQGDIIKQCGSVPMYTSNVCSLVDTLLLFNMATYKKVFTYNYGVGSYHGNYNTRYAKNFGVYSYQSSSSGPLFSSTVRYTLKGCVINGVVYGDTTMPLVIGIINISSEMPDKYTLSQNYPNPFNPVTNIMYSIKPNGKSLISKVKIIVYDITGAEIISLVNEEQTAGTYKVDFSGSGYASGMYFYSLIVDGITIETKKMVLLK